MQACLLHSLKFSDPYRDPIHLQESEAVTDVTVLNGGGLRSYNVPHDIFFS